LIQVQRRTSVSPPPRSVSPYARMTVCEPVAIQPKRRQVVAEHFVWPVERAVSAEMALASSHQAPNQNNSRIISDPRNIDLTKAVCEPSTAVRVASLASSSSATTLPPPLTSSSSGTTLPPPQNAPRPSRVAAPASNFVHAKAHIPVPVVSMPCPCSGGGSAAVPGPPH
jgi:hypothetical protein